MSQKVRRVGIIGGSGLYDVDGVKNAHYEEIETPFGFPSGPLLVGKMSGIPVAFLARHGKGHHILPMEINFPANIWAMASFDVDRIISISAVGSLREAYEPGHIVLPDQFFDHTRERRKTFYGNGIVGHISLADPVCQGLRNALAEEARELDYQIHNGGTYICIQGPNFSTRAESNLYRAWGMDIIGMTNVPEVNLACEMGMCYATMAVVTDYDCWHVSEEPVSVDQLVNTLLKTVSASMNVIKVVLPRIGGELNCDCRKKASEAMMTRPKAISKEAKKRLSLFLERIFP